MVHTLILTLVTLVNECMVHCLPGVTVRGVRGKQKKDSTMPTSEVAFGLIPEKVSYEAY